LVRCHNGFLDETAHDPGFQFVQSLLHVACLV
jgi:hypothetical protein